MDATLRARCLQHGFTAKSLPLLTESVEALLDYVKSQGASPQRFLGAASVGDWLKNAGSIGEMIANARLDEATIARACAEIADATLSPPAIIDRFLLPYVLLAAARPALIGDPPAWLVDAFAAMIAVDADDALLDVTAAIDRLDGKSGCLTMPWLARQSLSGRWLARQIPAKALWRVLTGAIAWQDAIAPELLAEALAIHNGVSARSGSETLQEDDGFSLLDGFHGLTAAVIRQRGTPACVQIVPNGGGLLWNLEMAQLSALGGALSVTQTTAAGFLSPPLAVLPLPPPLGRQLRAEGWHHLRLELDDADAADELLDALLDLAFDPLPPQTLDGLGFRIVPAGNP